MLLGGVAIKKKKLSPTKEMGTNIFFPPFIYILSSKPQYKAGFEISLISLMKKIFMYDTEWC